MTATTDGRTAPPPPAAPRRPGATLLRRWPTLLAVVLAGGTGATGLDTDVVAALSLLPTVYVTVLALGRRWLTWPLVVVLVVAFDVATRLGADPRTVLLVVAGAALGLGFGCGRGRRELLVQGAGLLAFGSVAVVGGGLAPEVAIWLVAAGWFAHGVWDAVHLWRDRVVARSFAEWCGVVDVLMAAQLVLVATAGTP